MLDPYKVRFSRSQIFFCRLILKPIICFLYFFKGYSFWWWRTTTGIIADNSHYFNWRQWQCPSVYCQLLQFWDNWGKIFLCFWRSCFVYFLPYDMSTVWLCYFSCECKTCCVNEVSVFFLVFFNVKLNWLSYSV